MDGDLATVVDGPAIVLVGSLMVETGCYFDKTLTRITVSVLLITLFASLLVLSTFVVFDSCCRSVSYEVSVNGPAAAALHLSLIIFIMYRSYSLN